MSPSKPSHFARTALTQAIEKKVERMGLNDLVELASTLNISMPGVASAVRRRGSKSNGKAVAPDTQVLQGGGIGPVVSFTKGGRLLDAVTVDDETADWVESEFVGAGELVQRLSISRGTLDNWRNMKKIVALRKGLRNFVYPVRQFDRRGPVDGLDRVAEHFATAEEAWEWLVAPNRMTNGDAPIDALHAGNVRGVVTAAAGAVDYA